MQGDMRHGFYFQRSLIILVCDVKYNGKLLIIKFTFLIITMYFNHTKFHTQYPGTWKHCVFLMFETFVVGHFRDSSHIRVNRQNVQN